MPRRSTEAKNLYDDEQKFHENLTQLNKVTEEYSQQQVRIKRTERAVPTAGRDVRRKQCLEDTSWTGEEKQGYCKSSTHRSRTSVE